MKSVHLDRFERDGFVGPIKLYEQEEARDILANIRIGNIDRNQILFDNDVNYDRHFDISELTQHIGHPGIIEKLISILGPNILCWRSEFFPKFPGANGTEWHQVSNYQYATGTPMLRPSKPGIDRPLDVTVWTTFTETTRETACMKFLPGSQKHRYYDESKSTSHGRKEKYESVKAETQFFGYDFQDFKVNPDWIPNEDEAAAMEMEAGQCVIFTARCVHASFPNTSKRKTRFAISSRYTSTDVRVYDGMQTFTAHGGDFNLERYGCVLVAGKDEYGFNKIRQTNNRGEAFPYYGQGEQS